MSKMEFVSYNYALNEVVAITFYSVVRPRQRDELTVISFR